MAVAYSLAATTRAGPVTLQRRSAQAFNVLDDCLKIRHAQQLGIDLDDSSFAVRPFAKGPSFTELFKAETEKVVAHRSVKKIEQAGSQRKNSPTLLRHEQTNITGPFVNGIVRDSRNPPPCLSNHGNITRAAPPI